MTRTINRSHARSSARRTAPKAGSTIWIAAWIAAVACSVLLGTVVPAAPALAEPEAGDKNWPQWRGPQATGVAPHADPPVTWSESDNVKWKVEIPGRGHASPVVWEDRLFLLTAIAVEEPEAEESASEPEAEPESPANQDQASEGDPQRRRRRFFRGVAPDSTLRFVVMAIDRATGKTIWERDARVTKPHEGTHTDGTWASASAVTDGKHVWASFGSHGIYCFTRDGEKVWETDLGDMRTRHGFGEGASPVLYGDTLVINWDHEEESFIVALDAKTGKERWRRSRDEITSWATPLVVEAGGKPQVVVNATGKVRGYDLTSGDIVWETGGMTVNTIPSPVHANGLVYVTSGFRGSALKAIEVGAAQGDITETEAVAWTYDQDTPYVPSPLLYDGILYILKLNHGILTALDAATGKVLYGPERLDLQGVYASPVGAAGRVYIPGRDGSTAVLEHGKELKVLSVNTLDDGFDASPAVVGGEIFLRGRRHLYALAEAAEAAEASAEADAKPAEGR